MLQMLTATAGVFWVYFTIKEYSELPVPVHDTTSRLPPCVLTSFLFSELLPLLHILIFLITRFLCEPNGLRCISHTPSPSL